MAEDKVNREELRLNPASENIVEDRLRKLKELMPEAFSEDGVDFEKLRLLLGDEVNEGRERYAFTWPGKCDAIRQAQEPTLATLRPCVEKSRGRDGEDGSFDSNHIYIEGDNLEVLKILQRSYQDKVKLIFIDPPYNTGTDFIYHDKFNSTIADYQEQAKNSYQSNPETSGRFHSDWCSMMYPRLQLAKEILRKDGSIFVSIDYNEVANLRKIMDEIFGEDNFQREIIWRIGWVSGHKTDIPNFIRNHDTILFYSRHAESLDFIKKYIENNSFKQRVKTSPELAEKCKQLGLSRQQQSDLFNFINFENRIEKYPIEDTWNSNEYDDLNSIAITSFSGEKISKLLDVDLEYKGQKSVRMLRRIIESTTKGSDIVMDFFAGSASTAHAVIEQNLKDGGTRRYIMVDLPEAIDPESNAFKKGYKNLCDVGQGRLNKVGAKIKDELFPNNKQGRMFGDEDTIPDIGFRVFKLDESGIIRPDEGKLFDNVVKEDRSSLDLIFEFALKTGYSLNCKVEEKDIEGYRAYVVADNDIVCCMDEGLTVDVLKEIAELEPKRVLILDAVLTDALLANALYIFKEVGEKTGNEIILKTM